MATNASTDHRSVAGTNETTHIGSNKRSDIGTHERTYHSADLRSDFIAHVAAHVRSDIASYSVTHVRSYQSTDSITHERTHHATNFWSDSGPNFERGSVGADRSSDSAAGSCSDAAADHSSGRYLREAVTLHAISGFRPDNCCWRRR